MLSNLDLAKWAQIAHVSRFEDYMEVGEVEITMYATMAGTLMVMGHIATKETRRNTHAPPNFLPNLTLRDSAVTNSACLSGANRHCGRAPTAPTLSIFLSGVIDVGQ
ncbi:Isoprenoid synthase domain protein [Raphanus sativus]|nr:Isoprenoid synthase domain protein [Raphanus sativus]